MGWFSKDKPQGESQFGSLPRIDATPEIDKKAGLGNTRIAIDNIDKEIQRLKREGADANDPRIRSLASKKATLLG